MKLRITGESRLEQKSGSYPNCTLTAVDIHQVYIEISCFGTIPGDIVGKSVVGMMTVYRRDGTVSLTLQSGAPVSFEAVLPDDPLGDVDVTDAPKPAQHRGTSTDVCCLTELRRVLSDPTCQSKSKLWISMQLTVEGFCDDGALISFVCSKESCSGTVRQLSPGRLQCSWCKTTFAASGTFDARCRPVLTVHDLGNEIGTCISILSCLIN